MIHGHINAGTSYLSMLQHSYPHLFLLISFQIHFTTDFTSLSHLSLLPAAMISTTPARYKKFPSLTNPVLSKTPENQQALRNLKKIYDDHSKDWDEGTRYTIIDYVLNGETEVTERIARTPGRHRLLQRNMTFAIWIVLRAIYGLERLGRVQYRFTEAFPGIDPASLVSPILAKTTQEEGDDDEDEDVSLLRNY